MNFPLKSLSLVVVLSVGMTLHGSEASRTWNTPTPVVVNSLEPQHGRTLSQVSVGPRTKVSHELQWPSTEPKKRDSFYLAPEEQSLIKANMPAFPTVVDEHGQPIHVPTKDEIKEQKQAELREKDRNFKKALRDAGLFGGTPTPSRNNAPAATRTSNPPAKKLSPWVKFFCCVCDDQD